ncbi:hypothetical protein BH11BAC3_BH11BAC3_05100 [soil metagenome]
MEMEVVRSFDNYFTANITLTKLHAEGIECYLKDEYTVTIDPILSNAIGGIKLIVKKEDATEVKEKLAQYDAAYLKSATCPRCGSNSFSYISKPGVANYVTAIFTWLFSSYAVAPEYVYQCGNCGFESERLPETFSEQSYNPN